MKRSERYLKVFGESSVNNKNRPLRGDFLLSELVLLLIILYHQPKLDKTQEKRNPVRYRDRHTINEVSIDNPKEHAYRISNYQQIRYVLATFCLVGFYNLRDHVYGE